MNKIALTFVLVACGFAAAWESQSRGWIRRIPQPDDLVFTSSSSLGPVGSHVDGCVRFKVGEREVLRLDPDGTCYVHSRLVTTDAAVLDGFRGFLKGATTTDSVGRVTEVGDKTTYHDFTIQSGHAGAKGNGGNVNLENEHGVDYMPTTSGAGGRCWLGVSHVDSATGLSVVTTDYDCTRVVSREVDLHGASGVVQIVDRTVTPLPGMVAGTRCPRCHAVQPTGSAAPPVLAVLSADDCSKIHDMNCCVECLLAQVRNWRAP